MNSIQTGEKFDVSNYPIFVYHISYKRIKLKAWNKHQKLCTYIFNSTNFQVKKKINVFFSFFFEIFLNFSFFIKSDNCIGKMTSKSIRLQPVYIKRERSEVNNKQIFLVHEEMVFMNCIYDYAHSFFGEDS